MVAYFLINLPLILLLVSQRILILHANPFGVRFLNLLLLPSPPSDLHLSCLHSGSPTLNIYLHLVNWMLVFGHLLQAAPSQMSLTDWFLGTALWFWFPSAAVSSRLTFNPSSSDMFFTRLTRLSTFLYYFILLIFNRT